MRRDYLTRKHLSRAESHPTGSLRQLSNCIEQLFYFFTLMSYRTILIGVASNNHASYDEANRKTPFKTPVPLALLVRPLQRLPSGSVCSPERP